MGIREKLQAVAKRLNREPVDVPEWADDLGGEQLLLQELSGADRDRYEASRMTVSFDAKGNADRKLNLANIRARLVVLSLVDADGKRVLSDADAAWLGQASGLVLDRLFEVASRLSGIGRDAEEDAEKNSEKASGGGSSAGSPGGSDGQASPAACGESVPAS